MSINLTDELNAATKKGKIAAAKQVFLEGDSQNVQKEIEDINARHDSLSSKHDGLNATVSEHTTQIANNQSQITANKSAQDAKNASLDANMAKLNTRDDQITELVKGVTATGGASVATAVSYDNTSSNLDAATAQGAIDELTTKKLNKTDIVQELGDAEDKVVSQKAVSTKLGDLLNNIKDLDDINKVYFEDITSQATINGFYGKNGVFANDSNWKTSDYIPCSPNQSYIFRLTSNKNLLSVVFFDKDKKIISGINKDSNVFLSSATAPEKTAYVTFTLSSKENFKQVFCTILTNNIASYIEAVKNGMQKNNKLLDIVSNKFMGELTIEDLEIWDTLDFTAGYWHTIEETVYSPNFKHTELDLSAYIGYRLICKWGESQQFSWVVYKDGTHKALEHNTHGVYLDVDTNCKSLKITYSIKSTANVLTCKSYYNFKGGLDKEIEQTKEKVDYVSINITDEISKNIGFINTNGVSSNRTDTNWGYSPVLEVFGGDVLEYNLLGHTAVASLIVYDSSFNIVSKLISESNGKILKGTKNIEENAKYIRICSGTTKLNSGFTPLAILHTKTDFSEESKQSRTKNLYLGEILTPLVMYDVCNDSANTVSNGGRNRNYSQALYLDHCLNGIDQELDIHFRDAKDRIVFTAPMYVSDANENTPKVIFNNGKNINEEDKITQIEGSSITARVISILHRSTLNSITKEAHPKILCIGDSITYGEQATMPNDNYLSNHVYHLVCNQLFMKDSIDNGEEGYKITFLGHYVKSNTFNYKDRDYTCKTHHEGIRGISIASHLNGKVQGFTDENGKWSLKAWLDKYRTLDDNGNRLPFKSGSTQVTGQDGKEYNLGTLITSQDLLNNIDVCEPTHVLLALGMNDGATVEQYKEMISIIQKEYPNIIIGIGIPDSAGTYFPSLHPSCSEECTIWNDTKNHQGSRHEQQYKVMKDIQGEFATSDYESKNVYVLPFFYVTPTAEGVSKRNANLPDAEYNIMQDNNYFEHYGWHASTHMNAYGHMNWGYCLYSWIKYTIAKSME